MSDQLLGGERFGRFVVVRDIDGRVHAVAASSVVALSETDDGAMLLLPGARIIHVTRSLPVVLGWLDGRGPTWPGCGQTQSEPED